MVGIYVHAGLAGVLKGRPGTETQEEMHHMTDCSVSTNSFV